MAFAPTATVMRPTNFDDLAGQEFVASTLKHAFSQGRIAPAYLFSGPRGVGKTSAARILAKALNCEAGLTGTPCGTCGSCVDISRSTAMDVLEIDGASNTSVNDVREIKDEVLFAPSEGRYKVYIIDEVHMLSNSAFNALLKTIEEPPPYVVFVFATTEIHKVPATIRSRCQQFHFRLIPQETIEDHLAQVAKKSGFTAEREALRWIAREAAGSMRDAYTLFDQVAAFSQGTITMEETRQKLKLMGSEKVAEILDCLVQQQVPEALSLVEHELNKGVEVTRFATELAQYLRTLLLATHGVTSETLLTQSLKDIPSNLQKVFTPAQIEVALDLTLTLFRNIRYSLNQRYELELLLIRIATLPKMASSEELVERLEQLKEVASQTPSAVTSQPSAGAQSDAASKPVGTPQSTAVSQSKPTPEISAQPEASTHAPEAQSSAPRTASQPRVATQNVAQAEPANTSHPAPATATKSAPTSEAAGKLTREQWAELTSHIGDNLALRALLGKVIAQKYDAKGFYVLVQGIYEQKQLQQQAATIEAAIAKVLGTPHTFEAKVQKKQVDPKPKAVSNQTEKKSEDPLELVKDVFRGTIIESQEKDV